MNTFNFRQSILENAASAALIVVSALMVLAQVALLVR
jgi:hypothetical protein